MECRVNNFVNLKKMEQGQFPAMQFEFLPDGKSNKNWMVLSPIIVTLSDGHTLTIPTGYVTDLCSTPRFLWGLYPPYGKFLLACLIHDYLYFINYRMEELGQYKAQLFADDEFLLWQNALAPKTPGINFTRYKAVRMFGKSVYMRNV